MSERGVLGLGDVDGERPDSAAIRLSGSGYAGRAMVQGERVALAVVGEVTGISFRRKDGVLVRTHQIKVESVAEATDSLATDVSEFLQAIEDAREGRTALPFNR
ncbi:MAG: hypothetical protein L0Z49_00700 [Actinobacteria bacterium]|nr:hypothetical protein [Actinomycetota bacterium]